MKREDIVKLTDTELLIALKKAKSAATINAGLFGLMIGVSIYSTVKSGFGFFTLFPLIFAMFAFNHGKKLKLFKTEMESRNL